jgi:hypothetical protein
MEHRAVVDAGRQVGGIAAARASIELDALDPAVVVEADVVVDRKSWRLPVIAMSSSRSSRSLTGGR